MPSPSPSRWAPEAGEILSVGELMTRVRGALEEQFSWVWVEGEVSNLRMPSSGHAYFTLLDQRAQLRAVCFRSTLRLLAVPPEEGQRVLARGRLTVYEARGDVQLVVEDVEPEGEGLRRLAFEALKRKLAAEGLFAAERKRSLPALPRAVGVVTSATGAALQDIVQVLGRRAPGVDLFVAPARVQGEGAAGELCRALERLQAQEQVDVIILGRGGGASEDLWAFNDETLVRAVAACRVPVISAVGHEIDVTLCDLVADLRAPTPSAAAELAGREWAQWSERLTGLEQRLVRAQSRVVERLRLQVQQLDPWGRTPSARCARAALAVDRAVEALGAAARGRWRRAGERVRRLDGRLGAGSPERRLQQQGARLEQLQQRLERAAVAGLERPRRQVHGCEAQLAALSPLAVLQRGYAIVSSVTGTVVRDAAACSVGQEVQVRLARGRIGCRVRTVEEEGSNG